MSLTTNPELYFQALQGHQQALGALRKGGRKDPFPSLVFDGPARVGKRLCAVWYAAFLNCLHDDQNAPCGECSSCKKINQGYHPDLHFSRVPEKKTVVGVSDVREAVHEIHHAPFEGQFRVWIIEDGERLTDEAQNALLKTLEEPPRRAVILLVTNLAGALIPTVSSRCRLVRFQGLPQNEVVEGLVSLGADSELADNLAATSGGSYGAALSLFREPKALEEREHVLELFSRLPGQDLWGAVDTAQKLEKSKIGGPARALDLGLTFFRDLLVLSAGSTDLVVHKDRLHLLEELAARVSAGSIRKAIQDFQEADHYLQRNVSPRLLMQRLCINISQL